MKNINVGLSGLRFEPRTSQMIQKERKIYRTQEMTKIILRHEKVKMVKLSLCTTCKYIEGNEVQLYSFLTLVGRWSTSCPSHFTPGEGIPTSH